MVSTVAGGDAFIVFVMGLALLVIPIWAIVDAISRPSAAFRAAKSSKALWIALITVMWIVTVFIGFILAVVYLAVIRPKVRAEMR